MIFRGILVFPNFARLKFKNEMCNVAQSKERCPGATQNGDQAPCPRAFLEKEPALLHHTSPQSSSPHILGTGEENNQVGDFCTAGSAEFVAKGLLTQETAAGKPMRAFELSILTWEGS